jgi:hypothetical protein
MKILYLKITGWLVYIWVLNDTKKIMIIMIVIIIKNKKKLKQFQLNRLQSLTIASADTSYNCYWFKCWGLKHKNLNTLSALTRYTLKKNRISLFIFIFLFK